MRFLLLFLMLFTLTACDETAPPTPKKTEEKPPELTLKATSFDKLPGWNSDKISEVTPAYRRSCARILRHKTSSPFGALIQSGTYETWQPICKKFMTLHNTSAAGLRRSNHNKTEKLQLKVFSPAITNPHSKDPT